MKIVLRGHYRLNGAKLTLTWEDGKIDGPPTAVSDLETDARSFSGETLKLPGYGPVPARLDDPLGFVALAVGLFTEEPKISGDPLPLEGDDTPDGSPN